jgi:uncharacterized membrane protein YeaQ/YmgE (transglycosylase-associated protein family)
MGDFIGWLVLGLAAGVAAMLIMFRSLPRDLMGWLGALVVGAVGGLLGGWFFDLFDIQAASWIGSFVVALAGGIGILFVLRKLLPQRA